MTKEILVFCIAFFMALPLGIALGINIGIQTVQSIIFTSLDRMANETKE